MVDYKILVMIFNSKFRKTKSFNLGVITIAHIIIIIVRIIDRVYVYIHPKL